MSLASVAGQLKAKSRMPICSANCGQTLSVVKGKEEDGRRATYDISNSYT